MPSCELSVADTGGSWGGHHRETVGHPADMGRAWISSEPFGWATYHCRRRGSDGDADGPRPGWDGSGRRVTVVRGPAGSRPEWDATGHPDGIYLYRLREGSYHLEGKLVHVR